MENETKKGKTGLIYLSDIHFRRGISSEIYDLDEDIRNELKIDLLRLNEQLGSPFGIVISGDIAFGGKPEEYSVAREWLEELCLTIDCSPENIWTTPGNHDVDWSAVENSELIQLLHGRLRSLDLPDLDDQIRKFMQDPEAARMLYQPLANYNEFAAPFECNIKPDKPFWEADLTLNDGSILRLRGVNSALVSDKFDNDDEVKLIVGTYSSTITRQAGVEYLTICHHPPEWLRDGGSHQDLWRARSRLQLFGHKHNPRITQVDSTVILAAGATQPRRREPNWNPSYGRLELFVQSDGEQRELQVDAYVRVWHNNEARFYADYDADGSDVRSYALPIDPWVSEPFNAEAGESPQSQDPNDQDQEVSEEIQEAERIMNPARTLTYRFLRLPYHIRLRIASELELLEDEDKDRDDSELFQGFFRRASETKKLEILWRKVVEATEGVPEEPNPFMGS